MTKHSTVYHKSITSSNNYNTETIVMCIFWDITGWNVINWGTKLFRCSLHYNCCLAYKPLYYPLCIRRYINCINERERRVYTQFPCSRQLLWNHQRIACKFPGAVLDEFEYPNVVMFWNVLCLYIRYLIVNSLYDV